MKAKELMIGDKVIFRRVSISPFVIEVRTLGYNHINELKEDLFHPIPLTAEILEKNGWWYDIEDMWQHDEVNFGIEKWNGRFQCYDINQIKLYSVHELQHALRLCGLNDLADNFKV